MKKSQLKRGNSVLKRSGFKKNGLSTFKRSSFKKAKELTPQQKLDSIVSKCVRLASANEMGMVVCVTCGRVGHWKEMQCGHYQKRTHTATRYALKNLGIQCVTCNQFNDGEEEAFKNYIDKTYGEGTAELLIAQAITIIHDYPYEQEIERWSKILSKLMEHHESEILYN